MHDERNKVKVLGLNGEAREAIRQDETVYLPAAAAEELFGGKVRHDAAAGAVYFASKAEGSPAAAELPPAVTAAVDAAAGRLREIALFLHANPETGNQEFRAAEILTGELSRHGFTVEKGLSGIRPLKGETVRLDTAFKATLEGKKDGPVIAIMLEYDALPMGHACGHNLIAVAGLGAALGLSRVMGDLPGMLVVLGTPAEDGGMLGGKIPLLGAGHFDGVDIALITHGGDRWDTGAEWLAVKSTVITFTGVPAHAAGAPHQGRSAVDAAVLFLSGVEMLREHVRPGTRLHGIITEGGLASNIVPEKAVVRLGARSLDNAYLRELMDRIDAIAKGAALAAGCEVYSQWNYGYSSPVNVPPLDELVLNNARKLGAEGIKKWAALASSDLGDVGQVIPTANLWFKVAPEGTELHTREFLQAAAGEAGVKAAVLAAKTLAVSAYQLLTGPELVAEITGRFRQLKERGQKHG